MAKPTDSGTTYHFVTPSVIRKIKKVYCDICENNTHRTEDCIFNTKEEFSQLMEEAGEDSSEDLEELELPEEVPGVVEYGSVRRTITGVMRIMVERGHDEGAELVEEMDKVAKKTHRFLKMVEKKKTGAFKKTPEEDDND